MSGVVKAVKKVFKAVGTAIKKVVKSPIFKAILIAAAIYFTGGLALGAMGSTAAAALPGIATFAETVGVTAGAFGAEAAVGAGLIEGATAAGALIDAGTGVAALDAGATLAGATAAEAAGTATLLGEAGALGGEAAALGGGEAAGGALVDAGTGQIALDAGEAAAAAGSPAETAVAITGDPAAAPPMSDMAGKSVIQAPVEKPGFIQNAWNEYKSLSPAAQRLMGGALSGIGSSIAANSLAKSQAEQRQKEMDFIESRSHVPDIRSAYPNTPFQSPARQGLIAGATIPTRGG
jgi:hypothetical protein